MTSGAFSSDRVSVDLSEVTKDETILKSEYEAHLSEGYGLANAVVDHVRTNLAARQVSGDVVHEPIDGNELHGVITGRENDRKKSTLRDAFTLIFVPDHETFFRVQEEKKARAGKKP